VVEFKRILCPVDLSELSLRPLAYAAALARWYESDLTALHVVPTFDSFQVRAAALGEPVHVVQPMSREEVLKEVRRVVNAAGATTGRTHVVAEAGGEVATIVDHATSLPADLIVMGTHGRSGFDRFVLGSVTEKVMRKAPCPVLTVPPHASESLGADVTFRRILCPMDFSPAALQGLGFALDLARQANGTVTLLHVVEWLGEEDPRAFVHLDVPRYRQQLVESAHERMQALLDQESRTWCEISEVVAIGRPYREVLRRADEEQSDLIVMGTQGRGGAGLLLFGSTTEQVVRAARCPVLTVRAPLVDTHARRPAEKLSSTVI
jgi:nucleotide-binding universal stress UspA family protein